MYYAMQWSNFPETNAIESYKLLDSIFTKSPAVESIIFMFLKKDYLYHFFAIKWCITAGTQKE